MDFKRISFLLLFIFFFEKATAQNYFTISGRVLESITLEPIAAAQIFLNGTTIGTSSDADGNFILDEIPAGIHELAIRFIGFENITLELDTKNLEEFYSISLVEKVYELDEITVKPDEKNWKIDFEVFKESFIGEGPFSENTHILNKEVLNFNYDYENEKFNAFALDRLEIENKDLGYKVYFYLESFEINFNRGSSSYYGQTLFEELTSSRKRTRNKWKENRETAYRGSFEHFIKTLIKGTLSDSGYLVRGEQRENNTRYVTKDTLVTSNYFTPIDNSYFRLQFDDFINVVYKNELEDESYLEFIRTPFDSNARTLVDFQQSSITLTEEYVLIDSTSYIYNPKAISSSGYWGFEKFSDLLPLNYSIEK
ncbi:MAG: hypothetical protein BalsKO_04420 [Balneolaceae bacterium]